MSSSAPIVDPVISKAGHSNAAKQDLWAQAFSTLGAEDQSQFADSKPGMLGVLKEVCEAFYNASVYIDVE